MFIGKEPFLPLTLVGFEKGAIAGACRHEVGDVHELELAGSQGQVDGQIDARAMDQHVQIVFARVETHHDQFSDVTTQASQQSLPFFSKWLVGWTRAAGKTTGCRSGNWRSTQQ